MAIIYTYPEQLNLTDKDLFVISEPSGKKTKSLTAGGLLGWIDANLQYDLQQVLNAGSIADENSGTWNTVEIFRNQGASEKFLQLAPSAGVSGEMKIFSKVIVDKGQDSTGVITSPQSEKLVIIGDGELTLSSSGTVDIAAADYNAQILTGGHFTTVDSGKLTVTTNENQQRYKAAPDPITNEAFVFETDEADSIFTIDSKLILNLECKVQDSSGTIGTNNKVLVSDANGYTNWADYASPAAASPTKSIQFNKGNNEFGGEEAFTYDSASNTMEIGDPTLERGVIKIHTEESVNPARLAFHDGADQPLAIESPLIANTDYVLTLPVDAPANAVSYLVSDTSGTLSWTAASGGGSASGTTGSIQLNDGFGNFDSGDFTYSIANATLNVGIGNNTNSTANGLVIGASSSKSGALSILGPNNGKIQFKPASTGNAVVELTFPDATPQANQILESDASGNLSWINTPTGGGGGAAGNQGEIQYNDGSGNFAAASSFKRDVATGAVTIGSQAGQIAALSAQGTNNLTTQGFGANLGVANFENLEQSSSFSTVVAIKSDNTTQSATELVTFYTPIGTTPAGSIVHANGNIGFAQPSDERLKENKSDYSKTEARSKIKQLKVKKYNFKADKDKQEVKGFFAQDVASVIPEAVIGGPSDKYVDGNDKTMRIVYSAFIPYLTAALQEALEVVEKLEATVLELQNSIQGNGGEIVEIKGEISKIESNITNVQNDATTAKEDAKKALTEATDAKVKATVAEAEAIKAEAKAEAALARSGGNEA